MADPEIPEGGGSKIKFMKGGRGMGGDVPPPVARPGAQVQPLFSYPFIRHEN